MLIAHLVLLMVLVPLNLSRLDLNILELYNVFGFEFVRAVNQVFTKNKIS